MAIPVIPLKRRVRTVAVGTVADADVSMAGTVAEAEAEAEVKPVPVPTPSIDSSLGDLLSSVNAMEVQYGGDLTAALAGLCKLTELEGVSIAQLREGFIEVNKILLAKPELCTEVMLPMHLGIVFRGAKHLTDIALEAGSTRATKAGASKEAKAKKAKEETATAQLAAAVAEDGLDF